MVTLSQPDLLALHAELATSLNGGRLQAIKQLAPRRWSLAFYTGQTQTVCLELQPPTSVICLAEAPGAAQPPDSWTLSLRKALLNARLTALESIPNDRIWRWHFQGPESWELVCELSGRHANLFLLNAAGEVVQSLRPDASQRALRRGSVYALPSPPLRQVWPEPLQLTSLPADGSRSQAVAQYLLAQTTGNQTQTLIQAGLAGLRKALKRAEQQGTQLSRDLDALTEAAEQARRGELLQGAYGQVQPGQREVTLPNYFDPELRPITLQLEPEKDLATQIQRAFQRSRKLERAAERALVLWDSQQAQQAQLQSELQNLEALAQSLLGAPDNSPRALTAEERDAFQRWATAPAHRQRAQQPAQRTGWRSFTGSGGELIRVGRSARDNADLSFRQARGSDLWLHVRNHPGSHVVVSVRKGQAVHPETLLEAASLALHYSEARGETQAEILYTPIKYVHRLKGGAPGQVQLQQSKTLLLRQDPQRLERLRTRHTDPEQPIL